MSSFPLLDVSSHLTPWVSVILFMGGVPDTPREQTHNPPDQIPPRSRHPPGPGTPPEQTPQDQVHPLGPGTPPRSRHHPAWTRYRHPPSPRDQVHPPDQVHPLEQTPPNPNPPVQSMLGDTFNTRAVRILLECNLI